MPSTFARITEGKGGLGGTIGRYNRIAQSPLAISTKMNYTNMDMVELSMIPCTCQGGSPLSRKFNKKLGRRKALKCTKMPYIDSTFSC
mmetsp:Transcript_45611/g.81578  ORF Transcript_45611/g.81578 Transcript_45611/m.81578 type:complete len:88 (-) Transcript_45611:94-357(-)